MQTMEGFAPIKELKIPNSASSQILYSSNVATTAASCQGIKGKLLQFCTELGSEIDNSSSTVADNKDSTLLLPMVSSDIARRSDFKVSAFLVV